MSDPGGKPFTIGGFYGKNKRKCIGIQRSVESVVKKHQSEKLPKPFPISIMGPCTKWKTFFRQQDAFTACQDIDRDVHVFAFESETFGENTGQRLYLVASNPVFWNFYKQMKPAQRHHYEVIPEGSVCKLYFDLEYDRTVNPGRDGDKMVDILIQIICAALEKEFNIKSSRSDVLDLEASTHKKFSRHLIFQLGKTVFKNNIHAGNFLSYVMSSLLEEVRADKRNSEIDAYGHSYEKQTISAIKDEDEKNGISKLSDNKDSNYDNMCIEDNGKRFAEANNGVDDVTRADNETQKEVVHKTDDGVKKEVVHKTDDEVKKEVGNKTDAEEEKCCYNETDTKAVKGEDSEVDADAVKPAGKSLKEMFQEFSRDDLRQMVVKNKHGDDVLFCDLGVYTKNRNFRLYLSSKLSKNNPLRLSEHNQYTPPLKRDHRCEDEAIFYHSLVTDIKYTNKTRILTFGNDMDKQLSLPKAHKSKLTGKESIDGYQSSPYREMDGYISSLITQDSNRGVIRHWTYFHLGELLLYEISHYRYCHNVGRQHRSNNIMYIVDLRKGVFYQKCHDPDCHTQNYKSEEWSLPRHVLPESLFDGDEEFYENMDDEQLLNSTLEMEQQLMTNKDKGTKSPDEDELEDGSDLYLMTAAEQMDHT